MIRKKLAIGLLALVVAVAGVFSASSAFADEPEATPQPPPQTTGPARGAWRWFPGTLGNLATSALTRLGITVDEDLADELTDAVLDTIRGHLEQAVADGRITEEQADQLLARLSDQADLLLARFSRLSRMEPRGLAGTRFGHPQTRGAGARMFGLLPGLPNAVADLLDMTPAELHQELSAGKTLSEVATEKGVSDDDLIEAIIAAHKEAIEQAVADGRITEDQAEWLLARAEAMAPLMLTNPFMCGGKAGGPGMYGRHSWKGQPGQGAQGHWAPQPGMRGGHR